MLCDKCSKNDVTLMLCDKYLLTPSQNSKRSRDKCYAINVPKMTSHLSHLLTSYGGKNADVIWREKSQNADVIWRENYGGWGVISTHEGYEIR